MNNNRATKTLRILYPRVFVALYFTKFYSLSLHLPNSLFLKHRNNDFLIYTVAKT